MNSSGSLSDRVKAEYARIDADKRRARRHRIALIAALALSSAAIAMSGTALYVARSSVVGSLSSVW